MVKALENLTKSVKKLAIAGLASLTLASPISAEILKVPQDYPTIQDAIYFARPIDEIVVSPGTYQENIIIYKDITMRSENPRDKNIVEQTILDGQNKGSVISLYMKNSPTGENSVLSLSGFTIQNGNPYGLDGSLQSGFGEHFIISNTIKENISHGLYIIGGYKQNNIIKNNGGDGIFESEGLISNNLIIENGSNGINSTSAFYNHREGIINNTICDNGGFGLFDVGGPFVNNIIVNNQFGQLSESTIGNMNIYNNSTNNCIQDWTLDDDNISSNPLFMNPDAGDFRLQPNSPCIDAGLNIPIITRDLDLNMRPFGSGYDIGAYEFTLPPASVTGWRTY